MKADIALVVGSLCVSALGAALLFRDVQEQPLGRGETPIGTLERGQNGVFQKPLRAAGFRQVPVGSILRHGDVIRTGVSSTATAVTYKGTTIELAELSMVSLQASEDRLVLRYSGAGIRIRKGPGSEKLVVETGGLRVLVDDADVRVLKDGAVLLVDRGRVLATDRRGKERTVTPGRTTPPPGPSFGTAAKVRERFARSVRRGRTPTPVGPPGPPAVQEVEIERHGR